MAQDLTDAQVEELSARLRALADELEQQVERTAQGAKPVDLDEPIGRLSRMDAMQQQEMAAANQRAARVKLAQVRAALGAAERGEYGLCKACEEPIGYQRLRVRPESPFCLSCQGSRERG